MKGRFKMQSRQSISHDEVLAGKKFYVVMTDASDCWITKEKIILPGKIESQSDLAVHECIPERHLSFLYKDGSGKQNVVKSGRRVSQIFEAVPITD